MPFPEPIRSFWYAYESLCESARPTPWGLVVTDRRYGHLYDANHAGIAEPVATLTIEEIRDELHPALRTAGCPYEHIEFLDAGNECPALRDLRRDNPGSTPDALMVHEATSSATGPWAARIVEITDRDEDSWRAYGASRSEFGDAMDQVVIEELLRRDREVFIPAGLRIFAGMIDGRMAGFASLISLSGAGYVDNVVTLPEYRRRGVAGAAVVRAAEESRANGDRATFLFAEDGGAPQRLYERLGFRTRGKAYGFTRRLDGV